MKKVMIRLIIKMVSFIIPFGIVCGICMFSGCTEKTPHELKYNKPPIGEGLFSKSRFKYINEIFGYPDSNDYMAIFDCWNETSSRLVIDYLSFNLVTKEVVI